MLEGILSAGFGLSSESIVKNNEKDVPLDDSRDDTIDWLHSDETWLDHWLARNIARKIAESCRSGEEKESV